MIKLNLVDWDVLNRVYYCLYQRQGNYNTHK